MLTTFASDIDSDLATLLRYRKEYSLLPGWFELESVAIWDTLLSFQQASGVAGNLLEIGVWCGKSAALSTLHARAGETCLFVDLAIPKEVRAKLNKIKSENMIYSEMRSSALFGTALLNTGARTFRWIHIDGEHSGPAVMDDLDIAGTLLSEQGVIAVDDFFSPAYPQITAAVFEWLQKRRLQFQLFLCGYNKGYLCRTSAFKPYGQFLKDRLHAELSRRLSKPLTVWKSTSPSDMNCFGVWERTGDFNYRGPDWDQKTIQI